MVYCIGKLAPVSPSDPASVIDLRCHHPLPAIPSKTPGFCGWIVWHPANVRYLCRSAVDRRFHWLAARRIFPLPGLGFLCSLVGECRNPVRTSFFHEAGSVAWGNNTLCTNFRLSARPRELVSAMPFAVFSILVDAILPTWRISIVYTRGSP
jgi:hypothetical protein